MSVRLTNRDREEMARALVRHRFQERAEELMRESAELFAAVYDERYDAQTQKLMRQLEKRHPGALKRDASTNLNANGMRVWLGENRIGVGSVVTWTPAVAERPMLNKHSDVASPALSARIAQFALDTQAFADELRPAYNRALGTLAQFTTGKKLAEEWPEAMPVIGNLIPASERNLPAVQLTAINDEFGLPPSETEAA